MTARTWADVVEESSEPAGPDRDGPPPATPEDFDAEPKAESVPLVLTYPAALDGIEPPPRRALVDGWLPLPAVTLFSGHGGTGKSQLAMQLAAAAALERPWVGLDVMRAKALCLFCEDDEDELHRRVAAVCRDLGATLADLEDRMAWISRVGADNLLCRLKDGAMRPTPLFGELKTTATDMGARLVVLDAAADVFGGDEINRSHVRQFIQQLTGLAHAIDGAVILLAHPSQAGRQSGDGFSGSTAWHNSVRARLYLAKPTAEDGDPPDPDARILTRVKANYSRDGEAIPVRWSDGVFKADRPGASFVDHLEDMNREQAAEAAFLAALARARASGRDLNSAKTGAHYAPRVMAGMDLTNGFKVRDLEQAMARLFDAGKIKVEPYGPASRGWRRIVPVEPANVVVDE